MQAKLVVVGGEAKPAEIVLRLPTVVGRGRDASLTLPHPLVSRKHCEIYEAEGRLVVRDLGSLNGTYIGSERITEAVLEPGNLLTIGAVTFRAIYGDAAENGSRETDGIGGDKTASAVATLPADAFRQEPGPPAAEASDASAEDQDDFPALDFIEEAEPSPAAPEQPPADSAAAAAPEDAPSGDGDADVIEALETLNAIEEEPAEEAPAGSAPSAAVSGEMVPAPPAKLEEPTPAAAENEVALPAAAESTAASSESQMPEVVQAPPEQEPQMDASPAPADEEPSDEEPLEELELDEEEAEPASDQEPNAQAPTEENGDGPDFGFLEAESNQENASNDDDLAAFLNSLKDK